MWRTTSKQYDCQTAESQDEEKILKTYSREKQHITPRKEHPKLPMTSYQKDLTQKAEKKITSLKCGPVPVKPELCKQRKCPSKIKIK